jgi:hypothetical protein
MKRLWNKIRKAFAIHIVSNSYGKDHDCLQNKELIEKYPLYGDLYGRLLTKGYRIGTGYKYQCKVCKMDWHK